MEPKQQDPCDYEQQQWEIDHSRDWILWVCGLAAVLYTVGLLFILLGW